MKRWIFIAFSLLWPTLLFAQNVSNLVLTPTESDRSFAYLNAMFGTVGDVLPGNGNAGGLLGQLFGVFNAAVLILAGIIVVYTFFIGTIKTAHEGELLGKEWSSIWIPLRLVSGIVLLIPNASGYSFIQIFMMWVIVQGIGVADSVWGAALNYMNQGNIIIADTAGLAGKSSKYPMIATSAKLLRSLTCVEMLQQELTTYRNYQITNGLPAIDPVPQFTQGIVTAISTATSGQNGTNSVLFPQSGYYGTDGVCGTVQWSDVWQDVPKSLQQNAQFAAQWQGDKSRSTALANTIANLKQPAQLIASNYLAHVAQPATALPLGLMNSSGVWTGPTNSSFLIPGNVLADAAAVYYNGMTNVMNAIAQSANSNSNKSQWTQEAQSKGWALAGAYYFDVVDANTQVGSITTGSLPMMISEAPFDVTTVDGITNVLGGKSSKYVLQLQTLINGSGATTSNTNPSENNNYIVSVSSKFITCAIGYGAGLTSCAAAGSTGGQAGQMAAPAAGVSGSVGDYLSNAGDKGSSENPVIGLAKFGNTLVIVSFIAIILMAIIGFAATIGLGCIPFCSVGAAGVSIVTALTNLFTPIFITLMTTGLTLSYYIPMIPFILFTFGVIGWFIAVLEAMLAAPIVALGVSHPEGSHPVLGKADPAVGLLVNVFLRPTFMIFGMLTGMMLSYVGVWLLNKGFSHAFNAATTQTSSSLGALLFKPIASIVIYTLITIQIIQKSFSLIHVIPDQVLRWIGINIQSMGGEGEAEGAVSGASKSGLGQTSQGAGSSATAGVSIGKSSGSTIKTAREEGSKAKGGTPTGLKK